MDTVELEKGMATVLPDGYTLGQMRAEQPTTTYDGFTWAQLRELARCLNIPLTLAALDSSKSNLSAAYLDHQTFAIAVAVDRLTLGRLLSRLFAAWLAEARLVPGLLPPSFAAGTPAPRHQWFWPSTGQHADPGKVAAAQAIRLASRTTTLPREWAALGLDWDAELRSAAKSLGVTVEEFQALLRVKLYGNGNAAPDPAGDDPSEGTEQP